MRNRESALGLLETDLLRTVVADNFRVLFGLSCTSINSMAHDSNDSLHIGHISRGRAGRRLYKRRVPAA